MDIMLQRILSLIPDRHGADAEFARSLGYKSGNVVADWRAGRSGSYRGKLREIAEKYNVTVDWLCGNSPQIEKPALPAEDGLGGESLGALLELPELPSLPHVGRLPGLLRHGGEQEGRRAPQTEAAAVSEPEKEAAAPAAQGTSAPEEKAEYTVEEILRETIPGGAAQTPASAQVLERLLQDPDKLADDLLLLTKALQNLSDDLRRGSKADGKGEVDA